MHLCSTQQFKLLRKIIYDGTRVSRTMGPRVRSLFAYIFLNKSKTLAKDRVSWCIVYTSSPKRNFHVKVCVKV